MKTSSAQESDFQVRSAALTARSTSSSVEAGTSIRGMRRSAWLRRRAISPLAGSRHSPSMKLVTRTGASELRWGSSRQQKRYGSRSSSSLSVRRLVKRPWAFRRSAKTAATGSFPSCPRALKAWISSARRGKGASVDMVTAL